jgi:hypothetical protein
MPTWVLSVLGSPYGVTWIASLLLGIALVAWGARMTGPDDQGLMESTPQSVGAAVARITRVGRNEISGFLVILILMIAMRFGY